VQIIHPLMHIPFIINDKLGSEKVKKSMHPETFGNLHKISFFCTTLFQDRSFSNALIKMMNGLSSCGGEENDGLSASKGKW